MSWALEGRANATQTSQQLFNLEVSMRIMRKAEKTSKKITFILSEIFNFIF